MRTSFHNKNPLYLPKTNNYMNVIDREYNKIKSTLNSYPSKNVYKSTPKVFPKKSNNINSNRYVPTFDIEGMFNPSLSQNKKSVSNSYKKPSVKSSFSPPSSKFYLAKSKIPSYEAYKYFGDKYNDYQPPEDDDYAPRVKRGFMGTEVPRRRKLGKGKNNVNIYEKYNPGEGEETFPCSNCGRCFVRSSLNKHQRVCARVFNRKRHKFDSFSQRAEGMELYSRGYKEYKKVYRKGDMPKWKKDSLEFRKVLRENRHLKVSEPWGGAMVSMGGLGGGYGGGFGGGYGGGWGGGAKIGPGGRMDARAFYGNSNSYQRGYVSSNYSRPNYGKSNIKPKSTFNYNGKSLVINKNTARKPSQGYNGGFGSTGSKFSPGSTGTKYKLKNINRSQNFAPNNKYVINSKVKKYI